MSIALNRWLEVGLVAAKETLEPFGLGAVSTLDTLDQFAFEGGAYVALVGPCDSVQLGILTNAAGNEGFARTMLGTADDEELEMSDIADAVCEVINIVAGAVKTHMSSTCGGLTLGLPIFVSGSVWTSQSVAQETVFLRIGEQRGALRVLRNR